MRKNFFKAPHLLANQVLRQLTPPKFRSQKFTLTASRPNPAKPPPNNLMPPKAAVNRQRPDSRPSTIFYPLLLQLCDQESPAVSVPFVPLITSAPPFPKNPRKLHRLLSPPHKPFHVPP